MTEKKLAHLVAPAPNNFYAPNGPSNKGFARKAAAYHAARAQGFYLATLEDTRMDLITNLCNEFHLASLYCELAIADGDDNIDDIGAKISTTLTSTPEDVGRQIWEILTWADIDPNSIAPFVAAEEG